MTQLQHIPYIYIIIEMYTWLLRLALLIEMNNTVSRWTSYTARKQEMLDDNLIRI